MAERWCIPVPQAMQRHTGCRFVKPKAPSPPTVPAASQAIPPAEQALSIAPHEAEAVRED